MNKIGNVYLNGAGGKLGSRIRHYLQHDTLLCRDVAIDVSSPEGLSSFIDKLSSRKLLLPPLVIGTTGNLPLDKIHQYSLQAPVIICPNFSKGISYLCRNLVPSESWDITINEVHHLDKKDSPSGTAIQLAKVLKCDSITSERIKDEIGEHVITMSRPDETIVIKHNVLNRDIFAKGAIEVANWLTHQPKGLYK